MMQQPNPEALKLLVTIVDRGKGAVAVDRYRSRYMFFEYLCMGLGTANSRILDYFGLSETEKDVVLTLAPASVVPALIRLADQQFHLTSPGRGIVFTIPLSGVSSQVPRVLCKPEHLPAEGEESEEKNLENTSQYDLILAIVNLGSLDTVMDAARAEGARGGTVLHARRVGFEDQENLLGFTLQPEKEVVAILTPRSQKQGIMRAISKAAGLTTEAAGVLFSLPVDDIMGLQPWVDSEG